MHQKRTGGRWRRRSARPGKGKGRASPHIAARDQLGRGREGAREDIGRPWLPGQTASAGRAVVSWRRSGHPRQRLPHRTLRFLHKQLVINNLREQRNFSFPIPFPISIWTQSHSAGLSEPTGDGWRIGLHPPDGLPAALVPLLELVPDRARLLALRCGGRRDLSASSPSWGCSLSRAERATWWPAWSGRGRPGS